MPMNDPNTEASRIHYVAMRKVTGCPPIIGRKTHWGYYVETKDGKVSIDQLNACNMWDAKTYCVEKWAEEQRKGAKQ